MEKGGFVSSFLFLSVLKLEDDFLNKTNYG